jgi:hypothetical protein
MLLYSCHVSQKEEQIHQPIKQTEQFDDIALIMRSCEEMANVGINLTIFRLIYSKYVSTSGLNC